MAVYDDEKEKERNSAPYDESSVDPAEREEEVAEGGGNWYRGKDSGEPSRKDSLSDKDLADKESTAGQSSDEPKESRLAIRKKIRKRTDRFMAKHGKKAWIFGLGGGISLAGLVIVAMILFGALKIPNFATNITSYHMARTARMMRRTAAQIDAERLALDTVDDSRFGQIKAKYQNLRNNTWGRYDKYRPKRVLYNMHAQGVLDYKYSEPSGILGRQRLEAVIVKGQEIPINDPSRFRLIQNYQGKLRFTGELERALDKALKGHNTLIRSRVAAQIRQDLGIRLRWWERKAANYKNATPEEADRILVRESNRKIGDVPDGRPLSDDVKEAADDAKNELDDCLASDECIDEIRRNGGNLPESVDNVIRRSFSGASIEQAIAGFSTINAVVPPLCMVYEGSLQRAGPIIDSQEASLQRSYNGVASAGQQQQEGDTRAEAVGAMNRKIGNLGGTVPYQRASGKAYDTTAFVSPQASTTGDFSVMDAVLPRSVANFFNPIADKVCPAVTSVAGGIALAATEVVLGFFSGGTSTAVSGGVKAGVRTYLGRLITNMVSRKGLRRLSTEAAAVGGATFLAHMLVLSRMGAQYNGLAQEDDFVHQVDMGGDLSAQGLHRQHFYGRPMKGDEVVADRMADQTYLAQQQSNRGIFERYLSLENPTSMLANTIVSFGATFNLEALRRFPISIGSIFSNLLAPFSRPAYAAETDDHYGIIQWGYSPGEEEAINDDPGYFPLENQRILDESRREEEIVRKYEKCFTSSMGTLIQEQHIQRNSDGSINDNPSKDCSPVNLGRNNKQGFGDLVFRYRLSKRNSNTLEQLEGLQNPSQPGSDTNANSNSGGIVAGDTSNLTCGAGSDAGVADGYKNGQLYRIRICSVQGTLVNAQIAVNFEKLLNDAQASGTPLRGGSGFRTMEQQIAVRKSNCGTSEYAIYQMPAKQCSPDTARPGYSNHQMGLAIDFSNCRTRSTACYQWLNVNADSYGLKNLPSEPWHWSVDGR